MVKRSGVAGGVKMTGGGSGLVNHAGARLLSDVADAIRSDRGAVGGDGTDQATSSWS